MRPCVHVSIDLKTMLVRTHLFLIRRNTYPMCYSADLNLFFQTNAASKHVYFNKAYLNLEKELLQFLTSQLCCATLLDNCAP